MTHVVTERERLLEAECSRLRKRVRDLECERDEYLDQLMRQVPVSTREMHSKVA